MRILTCLFFGFCLLQAQTVESILDKSSKALLGSKPEASKSGSITGRMLMAGKIDASVEVLFKEGGRLYVKMDAPAMKFTQEQGCDGKDCYSKDPYMGLRKLEGQEKEALLQQYDSKYIRNWRDVNKEYKLLGKETLEGKEVYKVFTISKEGLETTSWIDAKSYLPLKTSSKIQSPMGTITVDSVINEYHEGAGGMRIPKKMTSTTMGQQMVMTMDEPVFGKPIPDTVFKLPAGL